MNILPPEPPSRENDVNGSFIYLKSKSDREMYYTAYKAITVTETWDYIKNMTSCFGPESDRIYNKIEEFGYSGHSGCSYMCVLTDMQFIAKYGEQKFKERYYEYEKM